MIFLRLMGLNKRDLEPSILGACPIRNLDSRILIFRLVLNWCDHAYLTPWPSLERVITIVALTEDEGLLERAYPVSIWRLLI